jgi:tetratricopeptide (TPR) repeat protein
MRYWPAVLIVCASAFFAAAATSRSSQTSGAVLPITARSTSARQLFETGFNDLENVHIEQALQCWRAATRIDPQFALAYALISHLTYDPAEQDGARSEAVRLASMASPGEQLVIKWIAGIQQNHYLPAIAAMNDVLAKYPRDNKLAFLVGRWLELRNQYGPAEKVLARVLAIDKNYAGALNELAYTYAHTARFPEAFQLMDRYVRLVASDPNPQDSYAEMLRMAGQFDAALQHYHMALAIDPTFKYSQVGIADTYSLMGQQEIARQEYAKAIQISRSDTDRVAYAIQNSITFVRERRYTQADESFQFAAERAHNAGLSLLEADVHRQMAMYKTDHLLALKDLDKAETVLHDSPNISSTDRDEEEALILRDRAIHAKMIGEEQLSPQTLARLKALAASNPTTVVVEAYEGAIGSTLVMDKQFALAIPHLEEDANNPLSMKALITAYMATRLSEKAAALQAKLASLNVPTMEQAITVPDLRAQTATITPKTAPK